MKKVLLGLLLVHLGFCAVAQSLTEMTNLRFYEHHSSTINGGAAFGMGANGSQSGYDFVNHTYYNSFNAGTFGAYTNGEEANLDMVEHNGPFGNNAGFGFTSGVSTIWSGDIQGNGASLWVEASGSFDYSASTTVQELANEYSAGTPSNAIAAVQNNAVYISKIRNSNLYVAVRCYNVLNVAGTPSGVQDIYFDFDYKYGTLQSSVITVSSIAVQGQGGATSLATGNTLQMSATVLPANASNPAVTWSVTNGTGTATIDPTTGVLTGGNPGTISVCATASDGSGIQDCITITITPILVSSITTQGQTGATNVLTGNTLQMSATVLPANASNSLVIWSVTNGTGTATIDPVTGVLTGGNLGTVSVCATASDGSGVQDCITITVTPILVSSITVQGQGGATSLAVGNTLQMSATVLPTNASNANVTWSVTNGTGTATIDANGLLTAVTVGTITVIATAEDASAVVGSTTITISNVINSITNLAGDNLLVYPNPATNYITVEGVYQKVLIYSLQGKEVLSSSGSKYIDIKSLPTATYIIQCIDANGNRYTQKIQKR